MTSSVRVAVAQWKAETPPEMHSDGEFILTQQLKWPEYAQRAVLMVLPPGQRIDHSAITTPVQALSLVTTMINAEVIGPYADGMSLRELTDQVSQHLKGIHDTEQAAAFAAVRQLGGHRNVGISEWMELALGDAENTTVCEHILDTARLAVANTNPGRAWRHAHGLGFVLYPKGWER